jgi:hypothetical protein
MLRSRSPRQIIIGAALLGIAVTAIIYSCESLVDWSAPPGRFDIPLGVLALVLCPPQLLFAWCIDCEITGWGGLIMFAIVGGLNAGLYAIYGVAFVALRKIKD